ncbi:MAG TPA: class I SAM-dependent methyltransferase [Chloroflexi bacterium]|nr:MAG: methyltransferase type 11 [Chloroflexota bacterium]HDD56125.1 class I SAM-dependent methyltransferase [Chloroflexota bacterium]
MKDYLALHLRDLPYFRALLRAVEARFYKDISLPGPVLDLGCGDGHFASQAFEKPIEMGLDPWWGPIQEAAGYESYQYLVCAAGDHMPYPSDYFASAISNSVLEHIPDLDPVIEETARVLQPGAPFIFCVPNQRFLETLSIGGWLDRIGLSGLAKSYRRFFNRISRHYHCDSHSIWERRLENHGFVVESCWDYFPPAALHVLEWGHFFGLPSWISKILFGRWILAPSAWNLNCTDRLVRPHYERDPQSPQGVYSFYITRMIG